MNTYESIPGPPAHGGTGRSGWAFDKLDGTNLCVEWTKKRGWHKWSTRWRLFDHTDTDFGSAPALFQAGFAEPIEKVLRDKYKGRHEATAYFEFFGPGSFAGLHNPNDPTREIALIDIRIHRLGIVGPKEFLKNFGHLKIPRVVYQGPIDHQFIQEVREGKFGVNEGVVAKGGEGHKLWMMKVKTLDYKARIKAMYASSWEKFWE